MAGGDGKKGVRVMEEGCATRSRNDGKVVSKKEDRLGRLGIVSGLFVS